MPCRDYSEGEEINRLVGKINTLTRIACNAFNVLENSKLLDAASLEARQWWGEHKEKDERRMRSELEEINKKRLRDRLLSSMTSEEKESLGIKY
jgi:hypothetical protein